MFQSPETELPPQIRRLSAEVGRRMLCVVVRLRDHTVVGRFPLGGREAMVGGVCDWLQFVARAGRVPADFPTSAWAAQATAKILDYCEAQRTLEA
ncbi:MAG TPA: hypothetical protein VFL14_05100 [Xanthomonadales bacterium]|nr:hypothetical protein [Xanthomonadales bacterium]